ncbi:hypothetical protein JCM4814A_92750 [Streptomyces phaeofaciens JCM 4814]|uniref:Uncharacterized protein n=1 Tax=Streptomyces phaeofaciens TaxID=68254 RepID=A0A918HLY6_9ACTN|nr:hypothetical protein [Streptomyces phaeofaciens]GGT70973.1 hypothetical protein GCM10010226_56090 [Streptomyces phaeofaciens]
MSGSLRPGPLPATPADLLRARDRDHLLRTELTRVREAAVAWRNGLGALLAALIGFSLIKGRADIGQLSQGWAVGVGVALLAALIAGAVGALLLIRAAHGRPRIASADTVLPGRAADHMEALAAATMLRRGITLTLLCTAFLVAAVATTWYGPARHRPALRITTPAGTVCGSVVRVDRGTLVLRTADGEIATDLTTASAVQAVETCGG